MTVPVAPQKARSTRAILVGVAFILVVVGLMLWKPDHRKEDADSSSAQPMRWSDYQPPGDEASLIFGQQFPEQAIPNSLDARGLVQPNWVAVDTSVDPYRLYVVDAQNFRVLGYRNPLAEPPVTADVVLCQTSEYISFFYEEETGRDKFWNITAVVVDSEGNVYITDSEHHRIVRFDRPFDTDTIADAVYGQPSFDDGDPDYGQDRLAFPKGLWFDYDTNTLWVADAGNNRVLAYVNPLDDATADFIIGQDGNFFSRVANLGGLSASSLYAPASVSVHGKDVIVSDQGNNRILVYSDPIHTDAVADFVFGQDGRFDTSASGTSPHRLQYPEAAIADASGNILISDTRNHRLLLYALPESGNIQPIGLWGQWQSLHTGEPNFRGLGPASLEYPVGTVLSPDNILWVADRFNHRVLGFEGGTMGDKLADYVIGQVDLVHNTPNLLDNNCFFFPRDLAVDRSVQPNRLYVADFENNRVLGFESVNVSSNGSGASIVLGQPDFHSSDSGTGPTGLNLPPSVAVDAKGGVYVADRENSRVLYFADPFNTDTTADMVIGQPDFQSWEPNSGGEPSAHTLNRPEGVTIDPEGNVYVSDTRNHRVLRFDRPLESDTIADAVWGQYGDFNANKAYPVGSVTPQTFSYPMKVAISEKGLLAVTDTENHRVLLFDVKSPDPYTPVKVLGQLDRTDTAEDNAGGVSARSMSGPEGLVFVGDHLYVGDTANNRVLFFRDVLKSTGEAERVYGQMGDMSANFVGVARCSARNLWLPSGLDVDSDGSLYVTDREQSRVVVYQVE